MKREGSLQDYIDAAGERLQEAKDLYQMGRFGGATYLAGVAVECALNAFLPSGHQMRGKHVLGELASAGISQRLPSKKAREIGTLLTAVSHRWNNSQRYYPMNLIERLVKPKVHTYRDAKANANYVLSAANQIYAQALVIWEPPTTQKLQRHP